MPFNPPSAILMDAFKSPYPDVIFMGKSIQDFSFSMSNPFRFISISPAIIPILSIFLTSMYPFNATLFSEPGLSIALMLKSLRPINESSFDEA